MSCVTIKSGIRVLVGPKGMGFLPAKHPLTAKLQSMSRKNNSEAAGLLAGLAASIVSPTYPIIDYAFGGKTPAIWSKERLKSQSLRSSLRGGVSDPCRQRTSEANNARRQTYI